MSYRPQQHTSDALRSLRFGATVACWLIGLAFITQTITWAFTNYTEIRYRELTPSESVQKPTIVSGLEKDRQRHRQNTIRREAVEAAPETAAPESNPASEPEAFVHGATMASPVSFSPEDINRVYGPYDVWMSRVHQGAVVAGLAGLAVLLVQMTLAVVVGAMTGAAGIASIIRSHTWAMILCALAVPWGLFVSGSPYPGILTGYYTMISASETFMAGAADALSPGAFYGHFLLLPLAGAAALAIIAGHFRTGVNREILEGPSEFELAIEAEARNRAATSQMNSGRSGVALRSVTAADGSAPLLQTPMSHPPASVTGFSTGNPPPITRPPVQGPGEPLRRPI